ncbi:MAG: 50S ribosomal protein L11 methyltransferase [Proteocatella sp.]|nr:50S ribosomal protein L11 methyltransferase [Proteocatella sp.]MBP8654453.1 50S ribosomal protein L11 methyltransferase [Proteocatella sp.]NCB70618.1 50S ribosomal protein L11 methyltransferase [Clostridia bacterium]
MKWTEVLIKVDPQAVEAVTDILYGLGAQGVAIDEPVDVQKLREDELYWDYIDEKLLENDTEETKIMAYFSEEETNLPEKIAVIKEKIRNLTEFGLSIGSGTVELSNVNQEDWESAWKQYFKPVHVTDRIVVKPEWEEYSPQEGEIVIEIDPGMAFGTGTHETTSMCINQIEKNLKAGDRVIDIGSGSGILSMAAVLLGAEKATGVDLDPVAVRVALENVELNNLQDKIEILHGNLTDVIREKADIVVANIMADIILILLEDVREFIKDDGLFISSGIIQEKRAAVEARLLEKNFSIVEVETKGEWCAITAQKKS